MVGDDLVGPGQHRRLVGDVDDGGGDRADAAGEQPFGLGEPDGVDVGQREAAAAVGEVEGERAADAGARPVTAATLSSRCFMR